MRRWNLVHTGTPPVGLNQERGMTRGQRNSFTQEWRKAFGWLALASRIPALDAIEVYATCLYPDRRHWLDVGNAYPTVKAAIDGLVDARVIPDDKEPYVQLLAFKPARLVNVAGLELVVVEACVDPGTPGFLPVSDRHALSSVDSVRTRTRRHVTAKGQFGFTG